MAQKIKQNQTNFTSGVIAELTESREDVAFYFNGLAAANNLEVLPSGGMRRRDGLQFVRKLLRKLQAVDLSGATITAPQGGTAANVIDGNETNYLVTANNLSTTSPFIVVKFVFPTAIPIDAIDIINYKLSSGILDDELRVQISQDNVAFSDFGSTFNADTTNRSRRIRSGQTETVKAFQVVRVGATNLAATVSIGEVKAFVQGDDLPQAPRLIPFAYSTVESYMMAVSDRNMDVLVGDDFTGSISIPHTDAQLAIVNWSQSLDTLFLWHPDVRPPKIFRQGGNDEFDFRFMEWENVPQHDYGAGVGGVDEVQTLNDGGGWASGNIITILLEGERTVSITGGASRAASATAIQTALRNLSNTSATGITVADAGGVGFAVTFSGEDGKRPWGAMSVSVQSGNSVWTTSRTTKGQYPGEDIMSDARGWPRCGLLVDERLLLGGLKGVPNSVLCSVNGEIANFDIDVDDPGRALLFRPSSDQVGTVYQLAQGRNIAVFCDDGESYLSGNKLNEETAIISTTSTGSKEGMRVHAVEGAQLFIQGVKDEDNVSDREIGTSVQEYIFADTEQNYQSNIVSKLSSHLIVNPIDTALIKGIRSEDPAIMMMVNEDGTATAYTVLRNELVNAFMKQSLAPRDDVLKAVGVDKRRRIYMITERFINGEWVQYVERYNRDLLLDCGSIVRMEYEAIKATSDGQSVFTYTFDNPLTAEEIGVRVDGARLAPEDYTVNLGTKEVTLSDSVAESVKQAVIVPGQPRIPATVIRIAKMQKEVTGADHLEGEAVMTYVDGSPGSQYTVEDGAFTLDDYADTEIQYGFNFDVYAKLLPFRMPGGETLAGVKLRVINAILSLYQTGHVEIRANGGPWMDLPLQRFDTAVLDKSMSEMLFTGEHVVEGLKGCEVGGILEIRQTLPAKLTVRSAVREVLV